jgi:hypothetical protein
MGAAVNCLMHWGLGSRELFTKKTGANAPEQ